MGLVDVFARTKDSDSLTEKFMTGCAVCVKEEENPRFKVQFP